MGRNDVPPVRVVHTHRDSPVGSMRRGQRTFRPDSKEAR